LTDVDTPENMYCAEDVFDNIINIIKTFGLPVTTKEIEAKKRLNIKLPNGNPALGVIVLDSVASLLPKKQEDDNDASKQNIGLLARLMSNNIKRITNYAAKYGVMVIMINQVREKVGQLFGNPETTPGGRALKFHSSVRLRVGKNNSKDGEIRDKDGRLVGHNARVTITKNRCAKPYQDNKGNKNISVPIYYEHYFPSIEDFIFSCGRQLKIITIRNGIYKWKTGDISADNVEDFMKAVRFKGLKYKIFAEILDAAEEKNEILPPELLNASEEFAKELEKARNNEVEEVETGSIDSLTEDEDE
jgi:hypothetical protein